MLGTVTSNCSVVHCCMLTSTRLTSSNHEENHKITNEVMLKVAVPRTCLELDTCSYIASYCSWVGSYKANETDLLFLIITRIIHALFAPASKFHYWLISITWSTDMWISVSLYESAYIMDRCRNNHHPAWVKKCWIVPYRTGRGHIWCIKAFFGPPDLRQSWGPPIHVF